MKSIKQTRRQMLAGSLGLVLGYAASPGFARARAATMSLRLAQRPTAPTNSTVMLRGESGTGKEVIARAIHYNSLRKDRPFVTVDCTSLSENLLESELFGHVAGAFTGAINTRKGLFEAAHNVCDGIRFADIGKEFVKNFNE